MGAYTRQRGTTAPAPAPAAAAPLIANAADRAELRGVRQRCIDAQLWGVDRAFAVGFDRGEEIAWSSLDAFLAAQAAYVRGVQLARRGRKTGRVGERKSAKYGLAAAWVQVRYVLLVVAACVFFFVALRNRFWTPAPAIALFPGAVVATPVPTSPVALAGAAPVQPVVVSSVGYPDEAGERLPNELVLSADGLPRFTRWQWLKYYLSRVLFIIWLIWARRIWRRYVRRPAIAPTNVLTLDALPE